MFKNVLITGANRGLGLALAQRCVNERITVFAGARVPGDDLMQLARDHPQAFHVIALDVSDMNSVRQAAGRLAELTPFLDALVNNAAVQLERPAPFESLDLDALPFQQTMDVNVMGPLRVTQQLLPLLRAGTRKLVVNISSEAGALTDCWRESEFSYCMSKAALNMQTRLLANHLKPHGFQFLAIQPGWMRTDMGGTNAALHPGESALGIFQRMHAEPDGEKMFMDYLGNPLHW